MGIGYKSIRDHVENVGVLFVAERRSWLESYAFSCLNARQVIHGDQVQNTKGSWKDHGGGHVEEERRSMMNYMQTFLFKCYT